MALFRNFGVNRRNRLCGVREHASALFLDFLELAENCTFLDRKLISSFNETVADNSLENYPILDAVTSDQPMSRRNSAASMTATPSTRAR
jgi:hypothetical protein